MREPIIVGRIDAATLQPRLKPGEEVHKKLAKVIEDQAATPSGRPFIKILGEFQGRGNGAGKTFVQFTPLAGRLQGAVLSVCKDHIITLSAG